MPTSRRALLRSGLALATAGVAPATGAASATVAGDGIAWTQRYRAPATQHLFDVVEGPEDPFVFCGYTDDDGPDETLLRDTDRWGRLRSQRIGRDLGSRGQDLLAREQGLLCAGVDGDDPLLVDLADPFETVWSRTYDGTPAGPVLAATLEEAHAVGWTEDNGPNALPGVVVAGVALDGDPRWRDELDTNRRLTALQRAGPSASSVVAVGPRPEGAAEGWAIVYGFDGTRQIDRDLHTPGTGPQAAIIDGDAVVLAGTANDGWWLQRRAGDWSVAWTRTYPAADANPAVDDVVAREDGYGLLAHDDGGTAVVRTGPEGHVLWAARYAPYTGEDSEAPDRAHAMVPVDGDEFVLAGVTAPGQYGRDGWAARVGDPATTTPADTPVPTPTSTPYHSPAGTSTTTGPHRDGEDPDGGTATSSSTSPEDASPAGRSGSIPGLGVLAALGGLAGWLGLARRRD